MPTINADDGCPLHVEVEGRESAPVLMLSNSLGTNLQMWDDQAPEFAKHFRLVRYDRRGHGRSGVPKGPYSMERFGRDVLSIIDALKIKTINWCGLSLGGMVGQWLGANAGSRVDKLVLSNTNFNYADKTAWNDRIKFVNEKGLGELVGPNMERWFTKDFRARAHPPHHLIVRAHEPCRVYRVLRGHPRHGFHRVQSARDRTDFGYRGQPGSGDTAVRRRGHPETDQGRQARQARRRAHRQYRVAKAIHRDGSRFSSRLRDTPMDDKERHERGMAKRRKVLGNAWVDRANARKTDFNEEFQDFITRTAWGEIWTRPHYDDRTRRILVIGTMLALDKWEEFRMHVRAALTEGNFTPDDIKEIILQQAIYCGVPAANHAFKEAADVIAEVAKTK
jgi:4-carboxymuconolactone decarboxylase